MVMSDALKAWAVVNMGLVYMDQGDYGRAMECCRESLEIAERIGDVAGKAAAGNSA